MSLLISRQLPSYYFLIFDAEESVRINHWRMTQKCPLLTLALS